MSKERRKNNKEDEERFDKRPEEETRLLDELAVAANDFLEFPRWLGSDKPTQELIALTKALAKVNKYYEGRKKSKN